MIGTLFFYRSVLSNQSLRSNQSNRISLNSLSKQVVDASVYGAQNEAYRIEQGEKVPKRLYLQRVVRC